MFLGCRTVLILIAALAMVAWWGVACAVEPGETVETIVEVGGKQVPLPAGSWLVAGREYLAADGQAGAYGAIERLVLLRAGAGRVDAFAEIHANLLPVADGWGVGNHCRRRDLYLTVTRYESGWDAACYFVAPAVTLTGYGGAAWAAAESMARQRGLALPRGWISVGFRQSNRRDVLDLRFHFDPAAAGLPVVGVLRATVNGWDRDRVTEDPRRMAYVERLSLWGLAMQAAVDHGLKRRLSPDLIPPPPEAELAEDTAASIRLAGLDRLLAQGAIDAKTYEAQRALIEAAAKRREGETGLSNSMKKNLSFRTFGSIVDWILAFVVTLDSAVSTGITASIVTIHSSIFVMNDMMWDDYWAKRGRRTASNIVDFAYAAHDL